MSVIKANPSRWEDTLKDTLFVMGICVSSIAHGLSVVGTCMMWTATVVKVLSSVVCVVSKWLGSVSHWLIEKATSEE
jgi:hypothetical protein